MACSNCGDIQHNIQTCPRVRRCGVCGRRGHDRRNCPQLDTTAIGGKVTQDEWSLVDVHRLCSGTRELLVHLYWSDNNVHFERNVKRARRSEPWVFKATPYHGVHAPTRPTINFFAADANFVPAYKRAVDVRKFKHGVVIDRGTIEAVGNKRGYDFCQVRVGYPTSYHDSDMRNYWKYDLGNHRYKSMADLQHATVARLATPDGNRMVEAPADAVVAWW